MCECSGMLSKANSGEVSSKEKPDQTLRYRSQYIKGEMIAKGTFGKVYEALDRKTGQLLAIKTIRLSEKQDKKQQQEEIKEITNEINIMA